jgi:MoaA/NifB/PqqE/SkfB family radical SAM enzyme
VSESTLFVSPSTFLWLELTGQCQLACSHCYADSSPAGTHGTMTADDWRLVIDQAAEMGVRTVQFIGGEPTLHPDLPELVRHALSRALAVEVFTNLVHVTPAIWEAFGQPGVSLATSYYSDDPDQHAEITKRRTHARTRVNIAEAVRRGIPLRVGVIDLGDGQRAQEAMDELVSLGVQTVGYDRLRQVGRGVRDRQPGAAELCGRCADGVAAVSPDGSVWPCVFSRWLSIGDVRQQPLREIMANMPNARAALFAQGMPTGARACNPDCAPRGGECYPNNCPPYRANAGFSQTIIPRHSE